MRSKVGLKISENHWSVISHQRQFFDWLSEKYCLRTQEDWYQISLSRVFEYSQGRSLLFAYHGGCLSSALRLAYPEMVWYNWKFSNMTVPRRFWEDISNHRLYLDELFNVLQLKRMDDWYQVKRLDLEVNGGGSLISVYYRKSLCRMLQTIYCEYPWEPWRFEQQKVTSHFWRSVHNQRRFFDRLANKFHLESYEDWYKVKLSDLITCGARLILRNYGTSLSKTLQAIYPECRWQMWKFSKAPVNFWRDDKNIHEYMKWFGAELQLIEMGDWNEVSLRALSTFKGLTIVNRSGGISMLMEKIFPRHEWNRSYSSRSTSSKAQWFLFRLLRKLFPEQIFYSNFVHPNLEMMRKIRKSQYSRMEIDIYLPQISLAFEYHGQQHYFPRLIFPRKNCFSTGNNSPINESEHSIHSSDDDFVKLQKNLDYGKCLFFESLGVTLIEIPYWLPIDFRSLISTIRMHRPDTPLLEEESYSDRSYERIIKSIPRENLSMKREVPVYNLLIRPNSLPKDGLISKTIDFPQCEVTQ